MRVGESNRKDGQSTTIFSVTKRKTSIQVAEARASGCGKLILFKNSAKKAI